MDDAEAGDTVSPPVGINKAVVWRTLRGMSLEDKVMVAVLVTRDCGTRDEVVRTIFEDVLRDQGQNIRPDVARPSFLRHLFERVAA